MANCNKCGNEIPENDLATRKAYQSKDGRSFCAPCTAFLIAQQKAAKAKAQAQSTQAPQGQVKTTPGAGRKPKASRYKTNSASEITPEMLELKKAKTRKNLLILLGIAAVIFGLIGILVSTQMAKAKEEKQSATITSLRSKANETYVKAEQVTESSDTKAMDDGIEKAKKAVQAFEDYAKEIGQYDNNDNAKTIETHRENIKKLEKKIVERKSRIAQEDALQKTLEEIESKVSNPETIEALFKDIDELKKKGEDLAFSKDFFTRIEKIEQKGQELLVNKLFESAKKLRETQPNDYDTARSKFLEVLKKFRVLELYLRQENEIAESKEKAAAASENKPVLEVSSQKLKESIAQVEKNTAECIEQLKQIGTAKDAAENQPGEWRDLLDEKYSKMWKKDGDFDVSRGADNSITITVGKKNAGETAIYYIGQEYAWEDVTIEIEFTVNDGKGFTVLGRYYNEVYQQGSGQLPTFGLPWGNSFDVNKDDPSYGVPFLRTLEAIGDRLKIMGADLDPTDKNNNKNIKSSKFAKMGGIGMDFKPESKITITRFRVKVDK